LQLAALIIVGHRAGGRRNRLIERSVSETYAGNAIREVGPFLRDHLTKLKQNPQQPGEFLEATEATTLPQIFAALKTLGHQWVYMDLPFGGLLTIVIGDSVNEAFAAELTKRGAICNLR